MQVRSAKQLGAALRGTRVALNLPAEDLAAMMGTSHTFLSRLEQGKATAALQKLFTALSELGIAMHPVRLREGQVLYTYLHLAPAPELTKAMLDRKIVGIAYETLFASAERPAFSMLKGGARLGFDWDF